VDNATKYCELDIYLKSDVRIMGKFHVDLHTSSRVRPSDAIREHEGGFLVLSDVMIHDGVDPHHRETVMVRLDAMSYIELRPGGWTAADAEKVCWAVGAPG